MGSGLRVVVTTAVAGLSFLVLAGMPLLAGAQGAEPPAIEAKPADWTHQLKPDRWYLQAGAGQDVDQFNAGLIWELDRSWRVFDDARLTAYTEVSIGRWHVHDEGGSASATNTQIGFTPTLRITSSGSLGLFGELGIGVNVIAPVYRTDDKRFSTAFNFGDHIGVGLRPWGPKGGEVSLRVQHFSNAGIKHPNPGENFLQLRYSAPF